MRRLGQTCRLSMPPQIQAQAMLVEGEPYQQAALQMPAPVCVYAKRETVRRSLAAISRVNHAATAVLRLYEGRGTEKWKGEKEVKEK